MEEDDELKRLVAELSEAENEHLNQAGPERTLLVEAVRALCAHAGVPHLWDTEP